MALSSGFQLKQLSKRSPQGFEVDYGERSGTVDLKCPRSTHAAYIWEYATEPVKEGEWLLAGNSVQAKFRISNLTPGLNYWFRVSTVDKDGQHPPCDPLMVMVV